MTDISRANGTRELAITETALSCLNDVFANEVRQLNQKPAKPGILLKQRVNVVARFVVPKCRFVLSKGILLKQRKSAVGGSSVQSEGSARRRCLLRSKCSIPMTNTP